MNVWKAILLKKTTDLDFIKLLDTLTLEQARIIVKNFYPDIHTKYRSAKPIKETGFKCKCGAIYNEAISSTKESPLCSSCESIELND